MPDIYETENDAALKRAENLATRLQDEFLNSINWRHLNTKHLEALERIRAILGDCQGGPL